MVKEHFHPEVHRVWGGKVKLYRGFREAMFVWVNTKCLQYTSTRAHTWFKLPQVILPGNGSRFLTLSWTPLEHEITDATDFIYRVANESFQPNHRTGTFLRIDGWRRSFSAAPPWWSVWKPAWVKSKVSMDKNKELEYVVCSLSEVTSSSSERVSVSHRQQKSGISASLQIHRTASVCPLASRTFSQSAEACSVDHVFPMILLSSPTFHHLIASNHKSAFIISSSVDFHSSPRLPPHLPSIHPDLHYFTFI